MKLQQAWIARPLLFAVAFQTTALNADILRWDNNQRIPGTEGIILSPGVQLNHRELAFANLQSEDLTGVNFERSNLTSALFIGSTLTNADLTGANLANARFGASRLTGATFTSAKVTGARFESTIGFTQEQLYATASYQEKDLKGISFGTFLVEPYSGSHNNLTGWNFSRQNLTDANFGAARLTKSDFSGAVVKGASFGGTSGFTKERLYETASYQAKNLQGIGLSGLDLASWNFRGQDLSNAFLWWANFTNADLTDAIVNGARFGYAIGFTKEQLYSTASYRAKDLRGFSVGGDWFPSRLDLTDWDFRGQNLTDANLSDAILSNVDLTGANLTNANLISATLTNTDLTGADTRGAWRLDFDGTVSRNAILQDGRIEGLELTAAEHLRICDDDGVTDPSTPVRYWLSPRPPIAVSIQDRLTMAQGSVLQLVFDADPWDSLISFDPGIPVQLGGALELAFSDDVNVAAQIGRTLKLFDWTGVSPSGQFAIRTPYLWDVTKLYSTGEVTLVSLPEPSTASITLVGFLVLAARHQLVHVRLTLYREPASSKEFQAAMIRRLSQRLPFLMGALSADTHIFALAALALLLLNPR
jgi:uncharacterized protein YjbI with pentapeptide repeats